MVIYDESGSKLDWFDESLGRVNIMSKKVLHKYIVDEEEQGYYETIAEYPETGGKDVEWVVDAKESGHWETVDASTEMPIEDFDGIIAEDWPKDQTIEDVWEYGVYHKYTDEELAEEANKNAQQKEYEQMQRQIGVALSMSIMTMNLTDDQALSVSTIYPEWSVGIHYKTGDIRRYNGSLYRALQDSTAEEQYPPDAFVAGWKRIGDPNPEGIFPWSQPLGATDAYPLGAKVTHNGKTWESTIANNVWEPGVYGWKEVEDSGQTEPTDPDKPAEDEYPEWVQPTGAHDAYDQGAKVSHNGKKWTSDVSANVWEPGVYGWTEVK